MILPKFISSNIAYRGPRQTIRVDRLESHQGEVIDYYVVEHRDAVAAVPLTPEGEIVLIEQYRHPVGCILLDIPGGLIDEGEDAEAAVKREVMEETGYQADDFKLICQFYTDPSMTPQQITLYQASGLIKIAEAQPEKSTLINVHLLSPNTVLNIINSKSDKKYRIASSWSLIGLLLFLHLHFK